MEFNHILQHSLEGLQRIERLAGRPDLPVRKALFAAEELVAHGHPGASRPISILQAETRHRNVIAYAELIGKTFSEIRKFYRIENASRKHIEICYRKNSFLHARNSAESDALLVIFTNMFNNFYVSNAALIAMLSRLPCDILLLKDASLLNYHGGISGFAADMPGIAESIRRFADKRGKRRIYVSGYSSGGYAALLTSLLMPCDGYLGFSHQTDLGKDSPLPAPRLFSDEVRARVNPEWLLDCRPLLEQADPAVPRTLVYGGRNDRDVAHATHLDGLASIGLVHLPGAAHNTIQPLIAEGKLIEMFRALVAPG